MWVLLVQRMQRLLDACLLRLRPLGGAHLMRPMHWHCLRFRLLLIIEVVHFYLNMNYKLEKSIILIQFY